ncbi:hypothetical protein PA598K_02669 [Paenibacillus sp. 598K]|nr:hypothetical protein PA598K_02669 [Paenibacillus sp. 598K]
MIPASDRKQIITLIHAAVIDGARETLACQELGLSQRTLRASKAARLATLPTPANKLSEAEKQ